jgi:CHAD domain-containing protein
VKVQRQRYRLRAGLRPGAGSLLAGSLDDRWRTFLRELTRNRRRCTEPGIHDLRVATRRFIATVDMTAAVLPGGRLRKMRRELKKHLKAFSDLRDVHVQLLALRPMVRAHPSLRPFLVSLMVLERKLVRNAATEITRVKTTVMQDVVVEWQSMLFAFFQEEAVQRAGRAVLLGSAGATFARAVGCLQSISPADARSIHRFRVAFKKFRYTVEAVQPLLDRVGKTELKAMNAYQTAMGEIQDAEVLLASIRSFALRRGQPTAISFLPVYQVLTSLRLARVEAFMKSAHDMMSFWP